MEIILKQNNKNRLILEDFRNTKNNWWLSLHERKTGFCQTLIFKTKKEALNFYKKDNNFLSFDEIKSFCDKLKLKKDKIFKENI